MPRTYNDNPTRITQHQDYSVSLRLRRHGDGTDRPSMDMVVHGLEQASSLFTTSAMKCEEGRGMAGEGPRDAAAYHKLAKQYQALADQLRKALR